MFLFKKWLHRLLLLSKLKSDAGSGSGFSKIFDSGSERKTQNPAGVDSGNSDLVPPGNDTTTVVKMLFVASLGSATIALTPYFSILDNMHQGPKFRFEQLWKHKKSKYRNFFALGVWWKVILNWNKTFFLHCIFTFIYYETRYFSTPVTSSHIR